MRPWIRTLPENSVDTLMGAVAGMSQAVEKGPIAGVVALDSLAHRPGPPLVRARPRARRLAPVGLAVGRGVLYAGCSGSRGTCAPTPRGLPGAVRGFGRVFEMPAPGSLGYLPFAMELWPRT